MFSYEALNMFYTFLGYSSTPILLFLVLVSWRNVNCRYILSVLLSIEIVESLTFDVVYSWGNEYYLFAVFSGLISFSLILGRRLIAEMLKNDIYFFEKISKEYKFLKQEGALLFCYGTSTFIHAITYIEVSLYTNRFIENYIIQKYFFGPSISIIHMTCYILIISIVMKNKTVRNFTLGKASS
ncbi:hypothetical protein N474_11490 [Pseudoalteromonas luteoviolacea CPMOR-2]|uniref:Uncharacterized protein n=1 Tax=Pseudoalteromonas luteoviolacea DSM 6061 TaxID=1365250 RepID=A0A166XXJ7_9GAMM|nr:hypothetical protein N475_01150 [Pseudoalteromonas luteoviolacea DSM 6061]KZN56361.1 hypothetical protein N474_11490 [Pseudoalteromonas luteoviolacea CPMOR-2]MBE0386266.1 hypothetical protein [Pseudoalteromonas luteoviolacea DSM 6061]